MLSCRRPLHDCMQDLEVAIAILPSHLTASTDIVDTNSFVLSEDGKHLTANPDWITHLEASCSHDWLVLPLLHPFCYLSSLAI